MLSNKIFYHGIIRKTIVAFGSLFSNIHIDRKEGDSVTGTTVQRLQIPISYAPKEKWLVRLEQDPSLENHTYTIIPRMSFEITGYSYDSTRKVGKMNRIVCNKDDKSTTTFSPVPWNIEVSLYILTKTQEDGLQIIEQILPFFGPEYTITINAIPDMGIKLDVPITLNSVNVTDEYDGSFEQRRFVTHTLTFALKVNLFNAVGDANPIYTSMANVDGDVRQRFTAIGDPETHELVSEEWEDL